MANQRFQVLSAALILLLAAGCGGRSSSVPQGPTNGAANAQGAHRAAKVAGSSMGGIFHPNSEKYSDAGAKPEEVEDGLVKIQSRALFAKDGTTLVEATTGVLDGAAGPAVIKRVHARIFDPTGDPVLTQNFPHLGNVSYWSHTFTGLARHYNVRLRTHLKRTDDSEDDGVITNNKVKFRPDLAVLNLTGPATTNLNTPVTFQAQVSELNGDVGAHANCILLVDGQQVDSAIAIWVDAGHTVSCLFQYTFTTSGVHTVQVSAANVVPGDWDLANNTAQMTTTVASNLGYQGSIGTASNDYNSYGTFNGTFSGFSDKSQYSDSSFSASMYGYTTTQTFAFPIQQFSGSVTIDGVLAWSPTFTGNMGPVVSQPGSTCQSEVIDSAYGSVCALDSGLSFAQWTGTSGRVTYMSSHSDYTCTGGVCTQNNYYSNSGGYTYGTGAPALNIGTTQQLGITLVDASGAAYSGGTKVMTATPSGYTLGSDNCTTYSTGSYCYGSHTTVSSKSAFDSAPPGP